MTPGRDVAATNVFDHGRPGALCDPRALTQLQGTESVAALDPVKDGLAVRADHVRFALEELIGEGTGDVGEALANEGVQTTDLFDSRRVLGQDQRHAATQLW